MREGGSGSAPGAAVVATVKWFNPVKGFGFLTTVDGSPDIFCHVSAVSSIVSVDASTAIVEPGGRVELDSGRGQRGRDRDVPAGPAEERSGMVKFYNATKGYGFVVTDDGGPDVFVPGIVLNRAGLGGPETGQRVSVMVEQGKRGLQARDIELI